MILGWLPLIEAALTPGLVIGVAAALLYLWWRWRRGGPHRGEPPE